MAAHFSFPSEGARTTTTTPQFEFQQPWPASSKQKKMAASSPTSVITDLRFVSPESSSSSSSKCHPRGLHLSYSTSDGDYSDPDCILDSTGISQELGKSGNSGPLQSLPETHSLALEVTTAGVSAPKTLKKSLKRGDGEPSCRIPLFPAVNGSEPTSESTAIFVLADRTSDPGRGQHGASLHSSAALRSDKNYEERATTARASSRVLPTSASEVHFAAGDEYLEPNSEWSRTATSSESASEQDVKVLTSRSSARRYLEPDSGSTRDPNSRSTFSAELSSSTGMPLESGDGVKRGSVGPSSDAASLGYSRTPLRLFPGCNTGHAFSPSPRVQKAFGTYSLTSSSSDVGFRHQHLFLSGPLMGSMIPKPPPSKWDDAEKWIISPGRNKKSPAQPHHRSLQTLLAERRHSITGGQVIGSHHGMGSPNYSTPSVKKPVSSQIEHAGRIELPKRCSAQKKRSKALSFSGITMLSATSPAHKQDKLINEANGQRGKVYVLPFTNTQTHSSIANDKSIELIERPTSTHNSVEARKQVLQHHVEEPESTDNILSTLSDDLKGNLVLKHSRSVLMQELHTVVAEAAAEPVFLRELIKHRDIMGAQMTPVETPDDSTCATPELAASPSRHNTPAGFRAYSLGAIPVAVDSLELQTLHLEKLELRNLAVDDDDDGQPSLNRSNIWTTRDEGDMESAASLREDPDELERLQLAAHATSWEEAEQRKTLLRFRKKEAKIKAWEVHQRAQAEAEMEKTKAKVEKTLAGASEKMRDRLASASKKATEMTAAAEVVRNHQAAKIAGRAAELSRKAGLVSPTTTSSFKSCFRGLRA